MWQHFFPLKVLRFAMWQHFFSLKMLRFADLHENYKKGSLISNLMIYCNLKNKSARWHHILPIIVLPLSGPILNFKNDTRFIISNLENLLVSIFMQIGRFLRKKSATT